MYKPRVSTQYFWRYSHGSKLAWTPCMQGVSIPIEHFYSDMTSIHTRTCPSRVRKPNPPRLFMTYDAMRVFKSEQERSLSLLRLERVRVPKIILERVSSGY